MFLRGVVRLGIGYSPNGSLMAFWAIRPNILGEQIWLRPPSKLDDLAVDVDGGKPGIYVSSVSTPQGPCETLLQPLRKTHNASSHNVNPKPQTRNFKPQRTLIPGDVTPSKAPNPNP